MKTTNHPTNHCLGPNKVRLTLVNTYIHTYVIHTYICRYPSRTELDAIGVHYAEISSRKIEAATGRKVCMYVCMYVCVYV